MTEVSSVKGSSPEVVFQERWEKEEYRTVRCVEVRELDTQVGRMKYILISKPNGATTQECCIQLIRAFSSLHGPNL